MTHTNEQTIQKFIDGFYTGRSENLFIEQFGRGSLVIYSYGHHYPAGIRSANGLFFVNSDRYSNTTSKHTGSIRRELAARGITPEFKTTAELTEIIRVNSTTTTNTNI